MVAAWREVVARSGYGTERDASINARVLAHKCSGVGGNVGLTVPNPSNISLNPEILLPRWLPSGGAQEQT